MVERELRTISESAFVSDSSLILQDMCTWVSKHEISEERVTRGGYVPVLYWKKRDEET